MGTSVQVIIENGRLVLGTWQRVFLCEFDGPRTRKIRIKFIKDQGGIADAPSGARKLEALRFECFR